MGAYLSSPNRDKISEGGENQRIRFGASMMQGWRMQQEDAHNCILDFDDGSSFFAVYDGHGGLEVSKYAADHYPQVLKSTELWTSSKVVQALEDSFLKFDEKLLEPSVIEELEKIAGIEREQEGDEDDEDKARLIEEADLPLEQVLSRYGIQLRYKKDDVILTESDEDDQHGGQKNAKKANENNHSEKSISPKKVESNGDYLGGTNGAPTDEKKEDLENCQDENTGNLIKNSQCQQRTICKRDLSGNVIGNSSPSCDAKINNHSSTNNNDSQGVTHDSEISLSGDTVFEQPEGKKMRFHKEEYDQKANSQSETKNECKVDCNINNSLATNDNSDGVNFAECKVGMEQTDEKSLQNGIKYETHGDAKQCLKMEHDSIVMDEKSGIVRESMETVVCQVVSNIDDNEVVKKNMKQRSKISKEDEDEDDDEDDEYLESLEDEEEGEEDEEEDYDGDEDDDGDYESPDNLENAVAREALDAYEQYPGPSEEIPGNSSGTTACVMVIKDDTVYVANAGDSRCIMCRDGVALDLSVDHKPEDELERKRVEAAGGVITEDGRVNGGLNLSRALGDHFYKSNKDLPLKDQMISPFPDVRVEKLKPEDSFLVVACDGIWNSMTSQAVVDFVGSRLKAGIEPLKICEEICDDCLAETTVGDGTGCDNMTVIIVDLKKESPPTNQKQPERQTPPPQEPSNDRSSFDPIGEIVTDERNVDLSPSSLAAT